MYHIYLKLVCFCYKLCFGGESLATNRMSQKAISVFFKLKCSRTANEGLPPSKSESCGKSPTVVQNEILIGNDDKPKDADDVEG